jgi:transposase InsO family protein
MTHWHLDGERQVEIINFIDDYSRAVLASVAVPVATSSDVVRIFFDTAAVYGLPRSVLSDNGAIYTTAYRGSHTGMEIELATLGITFKHGKPYHPAVSRGPRNFSVSP